MKFVILIGDGMADNPAAAYGGKTALEFAKTPVMDHLAAYGLSGSARTVPESCAPGSDTAILNIMGYDPRKYYSGRAPLEAAGIGVLPSAGDTAFRCNMVALEDGSLPLEERKILSHNAGGIEGEESFALAEYLLSAPRFAALCEKHDMVIHPTRSFRHIAVQKNTVYAGPPLAPPHNHLGETAGPLLPAGSAEAEALVEVMRVANELLDHHPINEARRQAGHLPANGIWLWAEGQGMELPDFEKSHGKKGAVVSAVPLLEGIANLGGLTFIPVEGATGELDTNYEGKAAAAVRALQTDFDFVVVHVESPDECTHAGDAGGKIEAIERLDARTAKTLVDGLDALGEPYRLLILSDHKTLIANGRHDGDPVPFLLYDSRTAAKANPFGAAAYTEAECAKGPMVENGDELIERLFETQKLPG